MLYDWGEIASLVCSFCLTVTARSVVKADPSAAAASDTDQRTVSVQMSNDKPSAVRFD